MRKPSEVLQTVKLPIAVVDAILAVPANFISTAAGNTETNTELRRQRRAIDALHDQFAAEAVGDKSTENMYRPKGKGRIFNSNAT